MMHDEQNDERSQQYELQQLKSCQTLTMIALIGAPSSLLIGGVALSTAALVCAIVAFVRMRRIASPDDAPGSLKRTLYTQALIALVISIVAMVMNAIAFAYMFGAIMDAMQTGDVSKIFDAAGDVTPQEASSSASVWDR